jgi:hypothetical protein
MMLKKRPRKTRSQLLNEAADLTDRAEILITQLGTTMVELGTLLRNIGEDPGAHTGL